MALTFADNATDKVDCGSAAGLDDVNQGTIALWVKPANVSNAFRMFGAKGNGFQLFRRGVDGTKVAIDISRATAHQTVDVATGNMTASAWNFLAFTWDITNGSPKAYWGSLTTAAADKSSGAANGSGARTSDAADPWTIGNNAGAGGTSCPWDIATFGVWNAVLTLGQILDQQYRPRPTAGCLMFHQLGWNGTGTQPDLSGNGNAGTVTGATRSAHVPLGQPWPVGEEFSYVVPAAAAAGGSPVLRGGVLLGRTIGGAA